MNIVLATDDNFVQHCCVTMTSILSNNKDVHFYLFTEGLLEENKNLLKKQVACMGGQLEFCIIDSKIVSRFPMPPAITGIPHITIATYYRLLMEMVLPKSVDKVLYLDCDIVVVGSLTPLFDIDISSYALGVVYQNNEWSETYNSFTRLSIPKEEGYFNAGVLVANLDYWRANNVTERLLDFIRNHYDRIQSHDQDVLNAVLYNEVIPISYKWNFTPLFLNKTGAHFPVKADYSHDCEPVVIHYVSIPKPWDLYCEHPYRKEYYKYLNLTDYKGWRPKFDFNWEKFRKFWLIPTIGKLDRKQIIYKIYKIIKRK